MQDVERALGISVKAVESGGQDLVAAVLDPAYRMERENENFVYVQGYAEK